MHVTRDDDELGTTDIAPEAGELLPVETDPSASVVARDGLMAFSASVCLHMMLFLKSCSVCVTTFAAIMNVSTAHAFFFSCDSALFVRKVRP
jgi:hypothetical protein